MSIVGGLNPGCWRSANCATIMSQQLPIRQVLLDRKIQDFDRTKIKQQDDGRWKTWERKLEMVVFECPDARVVHG